MPDGFYYENILDLEAFLEEPDPLVQKDFIKVFIGDQVRDPFIIENEDQLKGIDPAFVVEIPAECRSLFDPRTC